MYYLFNKLVPQSDDNFIILQPQGKTFITGLAYQYATEYPTQLQGRLTKVQWESSLIYINMCLKANYPCQCAQVTGYLFALCTCGLSFCIPNLCIREAEERLRKEINDSNRKCLHNHGLEMKFRRGCSTSWLEINLNYEKPQKEEEMDNEIKYVELEYNNDVSHISDSEQTQELKFQKQNNKLDQQLLPKKREWCSHKSCNKVKV